MSEEGTFAAVAILPSRWPPPVVLQLFAREEGGTRMALSADSSGRLVVSLQQGSAERTRAFGPLVIPGAARVILMLTWSHAHISLFLNGVELGDSVAFATDLGISPAHVGVPVSDPLFPGLQLRPRLSDAEHLFLSTLIDLDQKLAVGDRYSLIRASGLLRQLLMDGRPLVHAVNQKYHVALKFLTVDFTVVPPLEPEVHWRVLDPEPFPGARTQACNLPQFLAAPCLAWKGQAASVGDLISACANAKGGVHLGRAKVADEQLVLDWDEVFTILGEEPSLKAIAAVCRVALRGFKELVTVVERGAAS